MLVFNATLNKMSGIAYNMVVIFIGVKRHIQQYIRYNI